MTMFSNEALFDSYTMLKPQVGTSFALQSLIGKKAVVWNDFRWPHPPLAWADMLNMLDNESFQIAVPKTDGAVGYEWNRSGRENVICVLTSNDPIVYVSGSAVNKLETSAWNERFGAMIHFSGHIDQPDPAFKHLSKCTRCYAEWLLASSSSAAPRTPQRRPPALEAERTRTPPGLR